MWWNLFILYANMTWSFSERSFFIPPYNRRMSILFSPFFLSTVISFRSIRVEWIPFILQWCGQCGWSAWWLLRLNNYWNELISHHANILSFLDVNMKMILRFPSFFCIYLSSHSWCVMLCYAGCVCVVGKFLNRINIVPIWKWAKYDRVESQSSHTCREKSKPKWMGEVVWMKKYLKYHLIPEWKPNDKKGMYFWLILFFLFIWNVYNTGPRKKNRKYINKKKLIYYLYPYIYLSHISFSYPNQSHICILFVTGNIYFINILWLLLCIYALHELYLYLYYAKYRTTIILNTVAPSIPIYMGYDDDIEEIICIIWNRLTFLCLERGWSS